MSSCARLYPVLGLGLLLACLAAPPALAQDGGLSSVSGLTVAAQTESETVVRIAVDPTGGMPTFGAFRAQGPERVIVDIAGAKLADGLAVDGSGGLVKSVASSTFDDGQKNVRLTFYLTEAGTPTVKQDGNSIVLTISRGATADPLAGALGQSEPVATRLSDLVEVQESGPTLASVDFQQQEKVSRVILQVLGSEPAVSQPESTLVVVDLPRAQIPAHITRALDTRRFFSAIDQVDVRPTRAGARVEIRLRRSTEYSVSRDGDRLNLDFKIPADLLAARAAGTDISGVAAPSTPDTNGGKGLGNASGSEILIGASGRTSDPQAAFGSGSGAGAHGPLAWAEEAPGLGGYRFTGRRMSIDLQEADIHTVLRFISEVAGINIVASDGVSGKVTVRLKDVPWDEALASVLTSKGYGAQRFGEILRIAPLEVIKNEQQVALEASKAKQDLEPLQTYIAPLNYAQASEVAGQVKSVISERGSVTTDEGNNQVIVRDVATVIASVRELLKSLDRQNRQVAIEARFVEASSSFTRALGIQWGGGLDASAATGYPTGLFFPNAIGAEGGLIRTGRGGENFYGDGNDSLLVDLGTSTSSGAISLNFGSIPGLFDISARLSALESEGWGKIVSNPRVTALDNETASVLQGARIPYKTVSNGGTQTQFITAALELSVTPHITTGNTVFLEITIANDRPDNSILVDGQPAISTKEIKTRVLVPDGDTTVLGGVYSTSESWSQQRVPGLASIPLIGYLFRNSQKDRTQNEMLVFITPRILPVTTGT